MDKEKLLEKARNEHKGKDLIKKEIDRVSGSYVYWVMIVILAILFLMQWTAGIHQSYPLMIICFALSSTMTYARFKVTKEEGNIWSLIIGIILTLYFFYSYAKDLGLL